MKQQQVNFHIIISYENKAKMRNSIDTSFLPMINLKPNQSCSICFKNKLLKCNFGKNKKEILYRDIRKIDVIDLGVILYFADGYYVSIGTEVNEKHNIVLSDIVYLLKRRCRFRFHEIDPICYPECESLDDRYRTDEIPKAQISFSLTESEIKYLILYDYLIDEKMIVFWGFVVAFLVLSIVLLSIWFLVPAIIFALLSIYFSCNFMRTLDGYRRNYQGHLHIIMYQKVLVVRLHSTDLKLEYENMKTKYSFPKLWRLGYGDFFTLVLPKRLVKENAQFFEMLKEKCS